MTKCCELELAITLLSQGNSKDKSKIIIRQLFSFFMNTFNNTKKLISDFQLKVSDYKIGWFDSFNPLCQCEKNAVKLLAIENGAHMCYLLRGTYNCKQEIQELMNHPVYYYYKIPKKKGGYREICAPSENIKTIQRILNYYLQGYYLCIKPQEVFGFVINSRFYKNKANIVANAQSHVGKKCVLNIDLKDFFPSISARRIYQLFSSELFNYNQNLATAFTLLTTFQGRLPTGAPTSPVLSNFICLEMDQMLINFALQNKITYTRYADDLTFSSDENITQDCISQIISIINKNDFEINPKKLRLMGTTSKQTVTGLVVNRKVNIDRVQFKRIRAVVYDINKNGVSLAYQKYIQKNKHIRLRSEDHFLSHIKGWVSYINHVKEYEVHALKININ